MLHMRSPWLDPTEQEEVCETLLHYNLLEFSNERSWQLRGGGTTDIYVDLRSARNHPPVMKKIARLYENPIRRLRPNRLVEVPDSISCFTPLISARTNIPYITIRKNPKETFRPNADAIGSGRQGDRVCIIDDVVTDGGSKIRPYDVCLRMGLRPENLVVLVDRQEGWGKTFAERKINLSIWAGMTLHDIRRYLIESGSMQRCDPAIEAKNPIIVALDDKAWDDILPIISRLRLIGCILKVNDLLLYEGIRSLLPDLSVYGRVMADIKGHDIENTLKNIAKRFLKCPPWAVTVHASGQKDMIKAVVNAFKGTPTKVLAVTLLTSFDEKMCQEVYIEQPPDVVEKLAKIARDGEAHGFVCSAKENHILRRLFGSTPTIINPGVRSPNANHGDQKRVATFLEAQESGGDFFVMGRQLFDSPDPVAEVRRVLTEELGIA